MDLTNASAIVSGGAGGLGAATMHRLAQIPQMDAKVVIADVSDERGEVLAIQSSSPLGPEKKPSTVIVMENVSILNGVLLRPIAKCPDHEGFLTQERHRHHMPTCPYRRWRFQCRERSPDDEWRSDERSWRTLRVPEDG